MQPVAPPQSTILLCTLNAKYIHAAFGLRYLKANMGSLDKCTNIHEFTIHDDPLQMLEWILQANPRIVGFGIYIWNVDQTTKLISLLKTTRPDITIIIGGPEVSHEWQGQPIVDLADHLITGEGEVTLPRLCNKILNSDKDTATTKKIWFGELPTVKDLKLPYHLYTDHDVQSRIMYVEASRGCPFKCQFCLSSLDKKVRNFDLEALFTAFDDLIDRGAKQFKFVDRTFNLKLKTSISILEYFLDKLTIVPDLFLHFEMVPDRFPVELRDYVARFPKGQIQFEIGIQTFNPEVAGRIQRRQNYAALEDNLQFLHTTGVHLHTDLIIGLPGEDMASFARGFDYLLSLGAQEIQVGILKRLNGAPIAVHTNEWKHVYSPMPPYEILETSVLSFDELARLRRFARYWNIIGNSGRFVHFLDLIKNQPSPFYAFLSLSDWLFSTTGRTHKISYNNMLEYLRRYWETQHGDNILTQLVADYQRSTGKKHTPHFLQEYSTVSISKGKGKRSLTSRQSRHHH